MIGARARSLARAALSERLVEVGCVTTQIQIPPKGDAEECLRELMVRHLSRANGANAEERSRVCNLLLVVAAATRGGDTRFLDALNVWYERVNHLSAWASDRSWRRVRTAYSMALRDAVARLDESGQDAAVQAGSNAASPATTPVDPSEPEAPPSTALVLADHWMAGRRIVNEVASVSQVVTAVLICNNASRPLASFLAEQVVSLIAAGPRGVGEALALWWKGRLHVRMAPLHSERVLSWLGTRRFCVGLHAMGVIYREPLLASFRLGVLNAHIGLLPEYKGRSVMEWSILAGAPTGITVFFMDQGIDTGARVVLRRRIDVEGGTAVAAKAKLFQKDGEMYRRALEALVAGRSDGASNQGGRRYYVMSALFGSVVEGILQTRRRASVVEERACLNTA
jgi:hypothetical protein